MYISGNDTTVADITVAGHEKTTVMPSGESACPMGPFLPNVNSSTSPTTVGGKTRGRINSPSIRVLYLPRYRAIQRAAAIPKKKVITVAVRTVLTEIHKGETKVSVIH